MTQEDRDRLVALKKAKNKLITQKQAAAEIGVTEGQVRRLLRKLGSKGDAATLHELRGKPSNRKISEDVVASR
jgi:predicted ArsR family transcriptional regulator